MFSKYKKPGQAQKPTLVPASSAGRDAAKAQPAPEADKPKVTRKPMASKPAASPVAADKNRKRKERLGEIKLELHRALLDNLNLAALDNASESDLRMEINSIATEVLQEKGIVLNREERTTLNQEL